MKVLFSRSGFPNRRFGIAYTQVDFDDLRDSYGKTASYGTFRQTELTAGIKLEKYLPAGKLFSHIMNSLIASPQ